MGASESVFRDPMAEAQAEGKLPKPQSQSRHSNQSKQYDYNSPGAIAKQTRKTSNPQPQPRPSSSPSKRVNTSPRVTVQDMHKTPKPPSRSFKSLMKQHVYSSPRATSQRKRKKPKPQSRPFNSLNQHIHSSVQEKKKKKKKKKKEEKKNKREKSPTRRPSEAETQPGDHERSSIILESDEEATPHTTFANDGVELKLGDISDLELRKKTAQLMAIAPGLPVADLYHLLVEKEGRFEVAKQNVIRTSQTPFGSASLPVRARAIPSSDPIPKDEEDVKVKIDFDDDFFIYDDECPDNQLPVLRRPMQSSHPKKAKKRPQKAAPKPRKGLATKKAARESGEYTGDINRGIRETSHDREFIASDDEIPLDDLDADYSDSDQSVATVVSSSDSDTDMAVDQEPEYPSSVSAETASEMDTDDGEDLEIDMQPEYAYNADVWAGPNPG